MDEILADPNINIKGVPDSMERIIYVSTVMMTLNAIYPSLSWLHGTEVLGHRLVLHRNAIETTGSGIQLSPNLGKVNMVVLGAMADELLKNSGGYQMSSRDRSI